MTARRAYSDLPEEEKVRVRARAYANSYQRRGRLAPETCERCGRHAEKHHPDYTRPLFVVWLCRSCHLKLHEAQRVCEQAEFAAWCRDWMSRNPPA